MGCRCHCPVNCVHGRLKKRLSSRSVPTAPHPPFLTLFPQPLIEPSILGKRSPWLRSCEAASAPPGASTWTDRLDRWIVDRLDWINGVQGLASAALPCLHAPVSFWRTCLPRQMPSSMVKATRPRTPGEVWAEKKKVVFANCGKTSFLSSGCPPLKSSESVWRPVGMEKYKFGMLSAMALKNDWFLDLYGH